MTCTSLRADGCFARGKPGDSRETERSAPADYRGVRIGVELTGEGSRTLFDPPSNWLRAR